MFHKLSEFIQKAAKFNQFSELISGERLHEAQRGSCRKLGFWRQSPSNPADRAAKSRGERFEAACAKLLLGGGLAC